MSQDLFLCVLIAAGILSSLFYAFKGQEIFNSENKDVSQYNIWHHRWLYLVGSAAGWLATIYLYLNLKNDLVLNSEDILIFLIAILGITGYLPQLISAANQWFNKIIK